MPSAKPQLNLRVSDAAREHLANYAENEGLSLNAAADRIFKLAGIGSEIAKHRPETLESAKAKIDKARGLDAAVAEAAKIAPVVPAAKVKPTKNSPPKKTGLCEHRVPLDAFCPRCEK